MLPETQFVLGGYGPMQDAIEQQASAIPNLRFLGGVTSQESQALMRQSAVYVNTSRVEGFPNTLLECASAGTPYVGFYDPDEAICGYGLGVHASTLEDMASSVRFLLSDENARNRISSRGKEYLVKHHDARVIGRLYEDLFTEKAVRRS
jgi:glycosyltransferase involved in cell wall biosynthesis